MFFKRINLLMIFTACLFTSVSYASSTEIRSLIFNQSQILSANELATIIRDVKGRELNSNSLLRVVNQLNRLYVEHGYPLSYSQFSGQKITNGVVNVNLKEDLSVYFLQPEILQQLDAIEGKESAYSVVLRNQPKGEVALVVENSSEHFSTKELIFSADNWSTPQNISVTPNEDDNTMPDSFELSISARVTGLKAPQALGVTRIEISDNDQALVNTVSSITVVEGASQLISLALDTQPQDPVTVVAYVEGVVLSEPVVFTKQNWSVPQSIKVDVLEDDNTINEKIVVYYQASGDQHYNNLQIKSTNLNIIDNDNAAVLVASELQFYEGESASYELVLETQPQDNVVINATVAGLQFSNSVIFTQNNWNIPQYITVSALEDHNTISENLSIVHTVSGDEHYQNIAVNQTQVIVKDNDIAAVMIDSAIEISEGDFIAYQVVLATQPQEDVVIDALTSNIDVSNSLTFSKTNWNKPQQFVLTAQQDSNTINEQFSVEYVAYGDQDYHDIVITPTQVTILDDDKAMIKLPTALQLAEGESATYSVALNTQPQYLVHLSVHTDSEKIGVSEAIFFTPETWKIPQNITLVSVEDDNVVSESVSISYKVEGDMEYASLVLKPTLVNLLDNDQATIVVVDSVDIVEGESKRFPVSLSAKPQSDVRISIKSNHDGVQFSDSLVFTQNNWSVPQLISAIALEDNNTNNESAIATYQVLGDNSFSNAKQPQTKLSIVDNDEPIVEVVNKEKLIKPQEIQQELANSDKIPLVVTEELQSCIKINEIILLDSTLINLLVQQELLGGYTSKCINSGVVGEILTLLNNYYINKAYVTTRAYIAPQDLKTGVLEFVIVEGIIEDIQYSIGSISQHEKVRLAFPVSPGDILNLREIEQGLDQINLPQSVQATMSLVPGSKAGNTIVKIHSDVTDNSVRFRAGIDNFVSSSAGAEKLTLGIDVDNLLGSNDSWSLSHIGSLDTNALALSAKVPVGYWTHGVNYSYSDYLSPIDTTTELFGVSKTTELYSDWLFRKNKSRTLKAKFSLHKKNSKRTINDTELSPQPLSVARVGINYNKTADYTVDGTLTFAKGLTAFNSMKDVNPTATTPRAQFSKLEFDATLFKPLSPNATLQSSLKAQISFTPLYGSEQLTVGGSTSVRGFSTNASAGDKGLYIHNDVIFKWPDNLTNNMIKPYQPYIQPYVGLDLGWVDNIATGKKVEFVGMGVGIKFAKGKLSFDLGFGYPITNDADSHKKKVETYSRLTYKVLEF
jgi:hemolysin activation/secretion protein